MNEFLSWLFEADAQAGKQGETMKMIQFTDRQAAIAATCICAVIVAAIVFMFVAG